MKLLRLIIASLTVGYAFVFFALYVVLKIVSPGHWMLFRKIPKVPKAL